MYIFNLSCWVNGYGIPDKHLSVSAAVIYTDNSVKWHHFQCNPNIKGWQFVSNTFSTDDGNEGAKKGYREIHIYLMCNNQVNRMMYKGVQLIKDDGESYQYDDEGNLVSAVSAAEKSHFAYNKKGSVTKMGNIDGTSFEYGYDSKNHLVRAANSEGIRYAFDYDAKGQPVMMTAEGGKHLGAVTLGRVYYIRDKYSGNYLNVKGSDIKNGTVVQLNSFSGTSEQRWKVLDDKNGYVQFELQNAPGYRLDLNENSNAEGAKIQVCGVNHTEAQKWKLHPRQDGSFQISSKGTKDKKGLSNAAQNINGGQAVQSYTLSESNAYQDWYFEPADEGSVSAVPETKKVVYIRARHSGQYIDVADMKTAVGSRAMQYYYNGGRNQQYRLHAVDGTYYQLEPLHAPGMVLAKSGKNDRGYDRLALEVKTEGAANQQFRFEEVETGKGTGYAIVCKDGNVALDVIDYSHAKSVDIILTAHEGTQVNKWWILEECSDRIESSMTYTSDGRQVESVTDARGNMVNYEYDSQNRLLMKAVDAKGNVTFYTYNASNDQLTEVKKTVGGEEVKVSYAYRNDRIKSITHNGFNYEYGYDAYGNQESVSAGSLELEHTVYRNRNGLVDRIIYATGETIRNEYDKEEQLVSQYLVKADGSEEKLFTNTYDNYGNVVKHEDHRNEVASSYQYDMIGRTVGADTTDGLTLRTAYDEKNRVKSYIYRVNKKGKKIEFIYGDIAKQEKPGLGYGVRIDETGRVDYAYDALGRLTSWKYLCSNVKSFVTKYAYVPGKTEGMTTNLIASVQDDYGTLFYDYDESGNITKISRQGMDSETKACQVRYWYDEMNQLIREDNK